MTQTSTRNVILLCNISYFTLKVDEEEPHAADALRDNGSERHVEYLGVTCGNEMLDRLEPWYFGAAFVHVVFACCMGTTDMQAFMHRPRRCRHRPRHMQAPRIEAPLWVRLMSGRIESPVSSDWNCGFASSIYIFRSQVNLSRTAYAYERKTENG